MIPVEKNNKYRNKKQHSILTCADCKTGKSSFGVLPYWANLVALRMARTPPSALGLMIVPFALFYKIFSERVLAGHFIFMICCLTYNWDFDKLLETNVLLKKN